jgi:arabinofuranosyltransferase
MPAFFIARPIDHPTGTFDQRVAAARQALTCGDLRDFMARVTGPLTLHGFFANLVHAPSDTAFRIPPEPADAVAKFCR